MNGEGSIQLVDKEYGCAIQGLCTMTILVIANMKAIACGNFKNIAPLQPDRQRAGKNQASVSLRTPFVGTVARRKLNPPQTHIAQPNCFHAGDSAPASLRNGWLALPSDREERKAIHPHRDLPVESVACRKSNAASLPRQKLDPRRISSLQVKIRRDEHVVG